MIFIGDHAVLTSNKVRTPLSGITAPKPGDETFLQRLCWWALGQLHDPLQMSPCV